MSDEVTTDKLLDDLHAVVRDAEALLKATADDTSERIQEVRARAEESLRQAKSRLADSEHAVLESMREAVDNAATYVKNNPWQSLGLAAAAGLVLGFLLRRRD